VTSLKSSLHDVESARLDAVLAGKELKKRAKNAECETAILSDELGKMNNELTSGVRLRDQLRDEIRRLQTQVNDCYLTTTTTTTAASKSQLSS